MILEDQYGVGDVVDTGQATGTVEEVGLRVTRIRDDEGVDLVRPARVDPADRQPQPGVRRSPSSTSRWRTAPTSTAPS